jgi:hypothetical protein
VIPRERPKTSRLRPILRGVADTKHLHLVVDDFVNRNIRPGRKDELAGVLGQANPPGTGKFPQAGDASVDGLCHTAGRAAGLSLRM